MRVYLSARYGKRSLMRQYAAELRRAGVTVDCRWFSREQPPENELTVAQARAIAREDCTDVRAADTMIFFCESTPGRGGRHVELGYAYALGKRVLTVGTPGQTLFEHLATETHATWADAKAALITEMTK